MKKVLVTLLIAASSIVAASAQNNSYKDENGYYHYETQKQQTWVPERRTGGTFGIGGHTIPGHYETQTSQVKVYHNQNYNQHQTSGKGWEGKNPHGMPPGLRKKAENDSYYSSERKAEDKWDNKNQGENYKKRKDK